MAEEIADLRPQNLETYKENARFLKEALDGENKLTNEYHDRIHNRLFNRIFSRESLVAIKDDKVVVDSESFRDSLQGLKENAKIHRSFSETPIYRFKKRINRRAFRDAYNWVRGAERPHWGVQKAFRIPDQVEKEEFTPDEVKDVLEGDKDENRIKAFEERVSTGVISDKNLLYFGSPDQLAGALFTSTVAQYSILFNRSFSVNSIMAGVITGAYASKSASQAKSAYDEGIRKGVADELHELGTWMKMDELDGKRVEIEMGDVPESEQVKLGEEPYFNY